MKKSYLILGASLAAIALSACGKTVQPGDVGVKVRTIGSQAGVDKEPIQQGYNFLGIGEKIIDYPVITRTYQWTSTPNDGDSSNNEEVCFSDSTGLPVCADVAITLRVQPDKAPHVYLTYRLPFLDLLNSPVRAYVRSAISEESEKFKIEQLYSGGRQAVIHDALLRVQAHYAAQGIEVMDLQWLGSLRYPRSVQDAIMAKTQADQQALTAQAQVAIAEAQARAQVVRAKGQADANALIAQSIATNPKLVEYMAVQKWDGHLPHVTGGATPMISLPN